MKGILVGFSAVLVFPHLAEANVPLVPVALLGGFSFMSVIFTAGLGLLVVILVEACVLRWVAVPSPLKSLMVSLFANLFSTVIGACVPIVYSSSFAMIPGVIIGAWLMTRWLTFFRRHTSSSQPGKFFSVASFFVFIGMGIAAVVLGVFTIPGHTYAPTRLEFINSGEVLLAICAAVALLGIGFLGTLVSEGYVLAHYVSKYPKIVSALLPMNIVSYIVLLLISAPHVWTTIHEKSWFGHR